MYKHFLITLLAGSVMTLTAQASTFTTNAEISFSQPSAEGMQTRSFTRILNSAKQPKLGAAYSFEGELSLDRIAKRRAKTAQSVWIGESGLSTAATALINTVSTLANEGLDPNAYYHDQLQSIQDTTTTKLDTKSVNELFSKVFLKLTRDLSQGVVDPLIAQKEWYRPAMGTDTEALLGQLQLGTIDLEQALKLSRPQHPMYQSQITMLQTLKQKNAQSQVFVGAGKKLQLGDQNTRVSDLRKALINEGDLEQAAPIDNSADNSANRVFDDALLAAVISFQNRHGLEPDGVVSKATLKALNTPIAARIEQVQANLERWRWMPVALEDTNILVNLPEYRLRMNNNGSEIFQMPVVVGKPEHQTPIFSETMKHVVFAPTWTVPASITRDELIPLEKRKPGYLKSEEIDFFHHGKSGMKRVARSSVTAETLNREPFPYVLRQRAGDKNVLGKVKFLMPNRHAIYLHDTQAKKLFGKARRAFSHGCIRLGNPEMMAYVIMQMEGHLQSEIGDLLESTSTTQVDLETHIPVHLAYFTAWQDDSGQMQFREDLYKQDGRLTKAIAAKTRKDVILAKRVRKQSLLAQAIR